jgi:hypothetical protein
LYRVVSSPGTNVMTSHLYRSEPPISTNVRHLYRLGCVRPPSLCERTFVPVGGSNRYKCPYLLGGQNTRYKWKIGPEIYVWFSSSVFKLFSCAGVCMMANVWNNNNIYLWKISRNNISPSSIDISGHLLQYNKYFTIQ